jgi:hypothetical protein
MHLETRTQVYTKKVSRSLTCPGMAREPLGRLGVSYAHSGRGAGAAKPSRGLAERDGSRRSSPDPSMKIDINENDATSRENSEIQLKWARGVG